MKSNHIAHLTSVHRSPDVRIYFKECLSLLDMGFRVTIVAPESNLYPSSHGVTYVPVPLRKRRLLRMLLSPFDVLRKARSIDADAYHIHSAELIPMGLLLRLSGKRVVFDAHEDIPDLVKTRAYIPVRLRPLVSGLTKGLLTLVSSGYTGVVAATPAIAEDYPADKTVVIQNFPVDEVPSDAPDIPMVDRPFTIIYAGALNEIRGIPQLVDAMGIVGPRTKARLLLLGTFSPENLEHKLQDSPGWDYTDFLGQQSRDEMMKHLSNSRLGVVTFLPAPNHTRSEPNKLFEYMNAGLPILCSDFPHWQQFVSEVGTGRMVDPADPKAIAREIEWFLVHPEESEEMGTKGRELARTKFAWESQARKLGEFYRARVFSGK